MNANEFLICLFNRWIFLSGRLPPEYDYFKCVVNIPEDIPHLDPDDPGEQVR